MTGDDIFAGLNDEQRRAVEAVRGPVCILAGAGSGKTTTIMRRIANQVATETFAASEILAVTFTDKAATEMRSRLHSLGVTGIRARTFHSAALAQLRHLAADPPGQVLPTKAVALRQIANSLPKPYKFRPAADLATEVEWAKNRCIPPDEYADRLGTHEPPIDEKHMAWVYREYERRKHARGLVDFEDLLALATEMFEKDSWATDTFRARYKAFTVDEYQDVNLLQQRLLDQWLGDRDDVCVVGDDYQSIYSFTGATARYLLEMPRRFRGTLVVQLETNYRSTPEVLNVANKLAPNLGGADKVLRATLDPGPNPEFKLFSSPEHETRFVAEKARSLHDDEGVPWEEMAVLYRTNYRSEEFEEELSSARIPYQVRGGGFLSRPAARRMLQMMRTSRKPDLAAEVRRMAERSGYVDDPPDGLGEQEQTRQKDLARLIALAVEFDDGSATVRDFADDLIGRFGEEGGGRGINLLTYHRAKGLEFDAVFLPRLNEGELPFKRARSDDALSEERRLLYVGITRARKYLYFGHVYGGRSAPSRFLTEIGVLDRPASRSTVAKREQTDPVVTALKKWRFERARADGVPAYVVMHDATLQAIAQEMPKSLVALASIPGIGPTKLDRYGSDTLEVLDRFR